jgi:hypothetical protein
MKVAVWDTYVRRADGVTMHFDILVPDLVKDSQKIFGYGDAYLQSKPFEAQRISTTECRYCHMEQASAEIEKSIKEKGYYILEMENCTP